MFKFERDTFAFANELVWQYRFDAATGAMTTCRSQPPATYSHRCFVMVRSVRQFFYHGRFDAGLPVADEATYRRLVHGIVHRDPRRASPESGRVVVPGYDGLRSFSQAHEPLLKAECGGAWQSYFLRSHWRMVFPVWRRHQERVAQGLGRAVREGATPIIHLFRFPQLTINHGMVLFGLTESEGGLEFEAYDPNIPAYPIKLGYDRALKTFRLPPACYWAGGAVNVIETFCGGLY